MRGLMRAIACVCVLLAACTCAGAQGWRGIVPLHSSREDVERVAGVKPESNGITYVLKDERVNVVYSKGGCEKGRGVEWDVPPGTVLGITIYPRVKLLLSDVRADLYGFEKFVSPHEPDAVYYNNDREGVSIGTRPGGEVFVIQYLPAAADKRLRCPSLSPRYPDLGGGEPPGRKFDEYSNISFKDERLRLDNLAHTLRQEPAMRAYIVVYAGPRFKVGEANSRLRRLKGYLVGVKKIDGERIVTKFGGCREKAAVELYVAPREELRRSL
jgi:hypothetical protein